MRLVTITLAILLVLIQYPLWMGKGGFFRVRELTFQLESVREKNEENRLRNAKLASEVRDLEVGTEAIEERARYELGMIKKDEIFIQIIDTSKIPDKNKPIESSVAIPSTVKPQAPADTRAATPEAAKNKPAATQKPAVAPKPPAEEKTAPGPSKQAMQSASQPPEKTKPSDSQKTAQ